MAAAANTVTLSTNFNVSPYYDDYDESKNFHRTLFKPGQAVQARELTQMQTVMQNQIDRFAEHVFKEGSAVRGCEVSPLDNQYAYVKLRDSSQGTTTNVYSFLTKTIKGATSGVLAKVVNVTDGSQANTPNFKTFYVHYVSANTTTGYKSFANNEILTEVVAGTLKANTITGPMGGATGFGSSIRINSGIIFAKDHFIRVDEQTLILDKYSNNPTYRVGFTIDEEIVTSADDTSLLDPASGSYNYAAPGADRLKLVAVLAKTQDTTTTANTFVEYVNIKNGIIQSKSDVTQYSAIRDELAKRTREESGDYIVRGLSVRAREHYDDGTNQGVYTTGNTSLLSIDVEPGKAYIQGYDNELLVTQHVAIDKGIDYASVTDVSTYADYGNYIIADNVVGNWDVNGQDLISLRGRGTGVSGQANAISTGNYSGSAAPGAEIGKARVRGIELLTGQPGMPSAQYKIHLTDIRITTAGKSFANTESVAYDAAVGLADGRADVLGSNNKNANTADPSFNTAVYRLPASAIKRVRTSAGAVNSSYGFHKIFNAASFNTSGVMSLDTTSENGSSSEVLPGSGTLSAATARTNFVIIVRSTAANTSNLTGTVTVTSSSNSVTGSGTAFTTQVNPGDILACSASDKFIVSQVNSDTALTLVSAAAASRSGAFHKRFLQGQVIDPGGVGRDGARTVSVSGTTATIDINETTSSGFNASVITRLTKSDAQEATKALARNKLVLIKMGASGTTGYTANTAGPWPLGVSDGFRINSVRLKGSAFSATTDGVDVTSHFTLDNGQRDAYYDHAQLVKKPTSSLSIGGSDRLLVSIDYFTHSNRDRGYFSIDSYPINDSTAGSNSQVMFTYQVPVFTSPVSGAAYDLRDCVDFRPRLTDSANSVTTLTNISTNPQGIATNVYKLSAPDFDEPSGGLRFPYAASLYTADLQYYLPRKDLIVMNKDGICESVRGVSSLTPKTPMSDSDKMTLSIIEVAPYPSLPDEIAKRAGRSDLANNLRAVKNERFTMRDIGVIRDRVDRLEYYTTLSLLEKDAKDLLIQDASGNDRFKNGFLVDAFTGHAVGNVYDADYKIAIDPVKKEGRPPAKVDNIELFYNSANSSNIVRTNVTTAGVSRDQKLTIANTQVAFTAGSTITSGGTTATVRYKVNNILYVEDATGNFVQGATITSGALSAVLSGVTPTTPGRLMTLPYRHDKVISQPFATTTRNTSGLAYNWIGTLSLSPNSDYWVDTTQKPDVQINIDNNADNWEVLANAYGTQWGSWNTVATGTPVLLNTQQISAAATFDTSSWSNISTITNLETYQTSSTQQQIGTSLGVSLSSQTQTIGDIVKDVNIQPFMRSRVIKVTARAMKPSSRLYAFFDGTDVSDYITPCNSSFANTANEGAQLRSDSSGNVYALFRIPNSSLMRFRTGEKIFKLTDNPTDATDNGLVTTSAQSVYAAQGLTTTTQDLTISTTVADVALNTTSRTRTIQDVSTVTTQSTVVTPVPFFPWVGIDPIAQSFSVDIKSIGNTDGSGAFISKIDLYFSTKDSSLPVIVELREIDSISGYPTPKVVPYGRAVVESSDVNVSSDGSLATPIYFSSPVFVQQGKSYAITIIPGGGNPNYAVWIARLGEQDILTTNRVASQPAAGMLFASSNDKTYTALQNEDLKFNIYFSNFVVSSSGSIVLKNEARDFMTVANLSSSSGFDTTGEIIHGETYLKGVFVAGNGLTGNIATDQSFAQGMTSGATGTITYLSTANGECRLKDVSTSAKFVGGEKIRFRLASATSGTITGNSTGGLKFVTYPTGKVTFFDPLTASNTFLHVANVSYSNSGPATGTSANNHTFLQNRWIKGQTNGRTAKIMSMDSLKADLISIKADYITPSNTSVTPTGKFATSTSARDSAYIPVNINNDTEFTARRLVLSRSVESNTSLSSSSMKDGSFEVKLAIETRNRFASPVFDTSRASATVVETLLNSSTTGEANTTSGGSAAVRYITRKIALKEGQDAEDLQVYFEAYNPPGTSVNVYYKVLHAEDSDTFAQARWMQMSQTTAATAVSASENKEDFKELQFGVAAYPSGAGQYHSGLFANSSPANILCYRNSLGAFYTGYKYAAIKIVLTGTNTTNPPRIRKVRAICLQK